MYKRKLTFFVAILLTLLIATSSLVAISSQYTRSNLKQNSIAQSLLQEHLIVSSTSYRLFKQFTDELIFGINANQAEVRNKQQILEQSIAKIFTLETQQRAALGEAVTKGSIEDTAELEALLNGIISDFRNIIDNRQSGDITQRDEVRFLLEESIDNRFRESINAAVNRQSNVVAFLNAKIDTINQSILGFSIMLAALAIPVIIYGTYWLLGVLYQPLQSIRQGAEAVAQGNYQYRIPRGFDAEFDDIADAFNTMAVELVKQRERANSTHQQLEDQVAQRTADLTTANELLRQNETKRREFLADISHELRTPLTIIRGETQVTLRQRHITPEDYQDTLQTVLEQAAALAKLVDDLLMIARTEAGKLRIFTEPVTLSSFTKELLKQAQSLAGTKSITVTITTPDISNDTFVFDPERIKQVLMILIDNAVNYSPANTEITLSVTHDENQLNFLVADQGEGIDPHLLPLLFERYFRAGDSRTGQGSGLGLAIAKSIVQAHSGVITATNLQPNGSLFTVSLPPPQDI